MIRLTLLIICLSVSGTEEKEEKKKRLIDREEDDIDS
jgi:hypothetical protein